MRSQAARVIATRRMVVVVLSSKPALRAATALQTRSAPPSTLRKSRSLRSSMKSPRLRIAILPRGLFRRSAAGHEFRLDQTHLGAAAERPRHPGGNRVFRGLQPLRLHAGHADHGHRYGPTAARDGDARRRELHGCLQPRNGVSGNAGQLRVDGYDRKPRFRHRCLPRAFRIRRSGTSDWDDFS